MKIRTLSFITAILLVVFSLPLQATAAESDDVNVSATEMVANDVDLSSPVITGFVSLDSGVKISWNAVKGAVKYRVYYKGKNGWTSMGDTASTSFIDADVSSGKTYTYSVRCVSADGKTFRSEMNTTGWKYTYNMATPKITSLTSNSSGVQITWGKVSNASRYRVYYKNKNGNWVKMAEVTGTSYLDSDVKWGGNYTYTVRCVNADGLFTSDYNGTGWDHRHYLATPKITGTKSSALGVTITWNKVDYEAKYRVFYKNKNNNWVKMGETSSTSFLDSDVGYGTTYTYTVRCITSDGKSFTSDYDPTGWKHTYYVDSPEITSFNSVGQGVKITWSSVGASKYRVYYYGSKGWTKMGESASTSFVDTDVRVGTTYRYTVRAITSDGSKFASDYNSTGWKYTYNPNLTAPTIKSFETVSNGVRITWSAVSNAYKYRVYYKNKNGNWVKMGDTTGTSYVDTDVSGGATYTYSIRCLAAKNDEFASGFSTAKSHIYVSVPSITKLESEKNGVRITWSKPTGANRFRVYYKNKSGSWVKMVETTATSYLDTDVKSGSNYTYTVRCVDTSGNFTSYYNTSGWKCTYTSSDWSTMYKNFVNENKNSMIWGTSTFALKSDSPLALHDFDGNGTPELIVGDYGARLGLSVYTIYNGKVVHAGCIGGKAAFYSKNPSYPGLFRGDSWKAGAEGGLGYYEVSSGKLVRKEVESFSYNTKKQDFDITIHNRTLYNVYLDCSTYQTSISRIPKYNLEYYYWKDIQSKGWNSFIAKYGY